MENFINLLDGTRIEAKFNFGTLYYLEQSGGSKLAERLEEKEKRGETPTDMESMKMAAKIIYAILRSNGKKATEDEAMSLIPPDTEEIENIVRIFETELEKHKKKEIAKANMKNAMNH